MVSYMDYTSPSAQFTFDLNKSTFFKKNAQNYINILGIEQLNTLENISLLDIFLSTNNVIEPHYHQNAAELVYCISGAATVSLLNPFTKQIQNYPITPGQVANIPQGWWHYEIATVDNTHLLAIFDAPTPEVILGSDLLKLTPSTVMAHTYCMDKQQFEQAIAPVVPSTLIGPPNTCGQSGQNASYPQHDNLYNTATQPIYSNPYPSYSMPYTQSDW